MFSDPNEYPQRCQGLWKVKNDLLIRWCKIGFLLRIKWILTLTLKYWISVQTLSVKWMWKLLSCVWFFVTPWTVACQAPLSIDLSRPEYWSGKPFPSPGDFPNPGIEPSSPTLQGRFFSVWATKENQRRMRETAIREVRGTKSTVS